MQSQTEEPDRFIGELPGDFLLMMVSTCCFRRFQPQQTHNLAAGHGSRVSAPLWKKKYKTYTEFRCMDGPGFAAHVAEGLLMAPGKRLLICSIFSRSIAVKPMNLVAGTLNERDNKLFHDTSP
jgi:hypothetical protein